MRPLESSKPHIRHDCLNRGGRLSRFYLRDKTMTDEWKRVAKGLLPGELILLENMSLKAGDSKPLPLMGKGLICEIKERMILARDKRQFESLLALKEDATDIIATLRGLSVLGEKEASVYIRMFVEI